MVLTKKTGHQSKLPIKGGLPLLTPEEESTLDSVDFGQLKAKLEDHTANMEDYLKEDIEEIPSYTAPLWHDYAMSKFESFELNRGKPNVAGLRRVVELLLGPILESVPVVHQVPVLAESTDRLIAQPAVVGFRVKILFCEGQFTVPSERVFGDVADVFDENTDPDFRKFPSAIAATRAEARCLRKALKIRTVSAEECTGQIVSDVNTPEPESPSTDFQRNSIVRMCQRVGLELKAFLQSGKTKPASVADTSYATAAAMLKQLSTWQANPDKIPAQLKLKN